MTTTIRNSNTNTNTNMNKNKNTIRITDKNRKKQSLSSTTAILVLLYGLVLIYISSKYLSTVNNDNNYGRNSQQEMLSPMAASSNRAEVDLQPTTAIESTTATSEATYDNSINTDSNINHPNRTGSSAVQTYDNGNDNDNGNNDDHQSYLQELVKQHLGMNASSSKGLPSRPKPPNELTLGAFIHIGKTGGSTLSATQLHYDCHSFAMDRCEDKVIANETYISKLTTYYHTPAFHDQGKDGLFSKDGYGKKHEFYLLTARDPYDRTISSYMYQHPYNQKAREPHRTARYYAYYRCAPTLEKFALLLRGYYNNNNNNNNNDSIINHTTNNSIEISNEKFCTDMFHYNSRRSKKIPEHLKMDITFVVRNLFRYHSNKSIKVKATTNTSTNYKQLLYNDRNDNDNNNNIDNNWNDKTILVVRTEHLNDDWISANRYLGQDDPAISVPTVKFRDSSKVKQSIGADGSELSNEGRKSICIYLREEYDVYFGVLRKAGNVNARDLAESLSTARKNCGSWLDFDSIAYT